MSEIHDRHVAKNNSKTEEAIPISGDDRDEACLTNKQLDTINIINKTTDVGILKEQNYCNDNKGILSLTNLYSNINYPKNDYISSKKKERPLPTKTAIRKIYDEYNGSEVEENKSFEKVDLDKKYNKYISDTTYLEKNNKLKKNKQDNQNDMSKLRNNGNDNILSSCDTVYYAVHIPVEFPLNDINDSVDSIKDNIHVYVDKEEVFKVLKSNKKARFKQFKTKKEAEDFSINGAEIISQEESPSITENEKILPFKRPKTEDMIQFRKDIERGDVEAVLEKISENPKYLVSNGDTPSILQEGSRYNALHVAAKAKNAKITRLILDSITRLDFIGRLYDDNDIDSCLARSSILLDRYLNTPDKGSNETPLHLAVKHGAVEVVEVLLSYSQCQKNNVFNKFKELPKDIICARVNGPCEKAKATIASMLEEQYFVPVLRSEDNSLQPKVGDAFSISKPLKLESDLLSPRLQIQAYAGPMNKEKADLLKKKWKTPSRCVKDRKSPLALVLRDTEKGLEKTGRILAAELDVPWQEYWSFLDTFVDISSEHGLRLLENYLKKRFEECFIIEKKTDNDSFSKVSEKVSCPINDLCEAFEMCNSNEKPSPVSNSRPKRQSLNFNSVQREHKKTNESIKSIGKNPIVYVERSCEVFGRRIGTVISSCLDFKNHAESLKESLESEIKHLQTLVRSYKEDNRFQAVDFQLIHSRVATIAIQSLRELSQSNKHFILKALEEIDWSDGVLSDDEDLIYNCKNCNNEMQGTTIKQLHCLVKHLIMQLRNCQDISQAIPSFQDDTDCQILWAEAIPCTCVWGKITFKKGRGALKRKQNRNDCDCDCDISPKKIQFEEENDQFLEALTTVDDENDEDFSTPNAGNSDTEEDDMEDVEEIPNVFLLPGCQPSKIDYTVLEAIEKVPLSAENYPNIYLWRHILQMQPKNKPLEHHTSTPDFIKRKPNLDSSISSPCKLLDRSLGNCDSPSLKETVMEPWERVTGPYSPRRPTRSALSVLYYQDALTSR